MHILMIFLAHVAYFMFKNIIIIVGVHDIAIKYAKSSKDNDMHK